MGLPQTELNPLAGLRTTPWRHQREAVAFVRNLYRRGKRGAMIAAVMGTGKSAMTVYLCVEEGFQLILILCPLRVVQVWRPQFEMHSDVPFLLVPLDDSFASVRAKRAEAERQIALAKARGVPVVVVINYDSAWRSPFAELALKQKWDLVVADECVPAGTKIATPDGDRPIESIRVGDKVLAFDHGTQSVVTAAVRATFQRRTRTPLVEIGSTRLTPEHPVWVESKGYTPAVEVSSQDYIRRINTDGRVEVRMVRDLFSAGEAPTVLRPVVFSEVAHVEAGLRGQPAHPQAGRGISASDAASSPQPEGDGESPAVSAVRPQPIPGSCEAGRGPEQSAQETGGVRLLHVEWRERERADATATDVGEALGLAHGVCGADEEFAGVSVPLQAGHCESGTPDRDRGRRAKSLEQGGPGHGHQEDAVLGRAGMDRPAFPQCGSAAEPVGGLTGDSEGTVVYNIETASGNYFADGLLVHNCHRLKAPGGKASRYVARLGQAARFRLGLSGTPMPHSPLDVYAYFRFIDSSIFGWSFHKFRQHYAVMGGYQNHQVVGYRNLDELNQKFYSVTFACGKDVLDLPAEVHITYTCQLGAEARKVYRSLERDLIAEVQAGEVTAANALVKLLRLQQITGGYIRTDDGHDVQIDAAKMNLLRDVMEDIAPDEPVVVFCRFHKDLEAVNRVADETGRRSLELSGRIDELKRWQAGEAPVLAVQIDSGGVGVDLTRARYAIYYSLGFSLGSYEQSLARIHRPGQTRPVEYIHLLAEGTVDEKVMAALARRSDVVNTVLQEMKGLP
ncbi:MAG TPA: SNF2-related protein [Bryobacteraceae bacterium]|nr:SNF2-related protein [Bryobacteraceae bacterium]HPU74297.1 SNF2-related protein [Bryobacteraceae bacterium]